MPLRLLRRIPVTLALMVTLLIVGIATGALFAPAGDTDWIDGVSYGLPAFADGQWWGIITGSFILLEPLGYLGVFLLIPVSVGWLEWRRGSARAALVFAVGQVVAILVSAGILWLAAAAGSPWGIEWAAVYDAGPSGGVFACLAAAACTLPQPWRGRAQIMLIAVTLVSVLFLGTIADLEHGVAVAVVLAVMWRSFTRPSMHEQRFIAWVVMLAIGAVQIITALVPITGPFGTTDPASGLPVDVTIEAAIVIVVAEGLRRGLRLAWLVSIVFAGLNVLLGVLFLLVLVLAPEDFAADRDLYTLGAATATMWIVFAVYLSFVAGAFAVRLRRRVPGQSSLNPAQRRAFVAARGGGTLSWMATWRDNSEFMAPGGAAMVAYQVHSGVAIALSDPIGEDRPGALRAFSDSCERAGLIPCVFGASAEMRDVMPGWRSTQVAEDAIIDLPGLEFKGKPWNSVRTALNRAVREGVTFRLSRLADEPWAIRRQIDAISEQWVGEKDLPEMRFTLGTIEEALDPSVRLALAVDEAGVVQGFLSWLPVFGPDELPMGWTLDLMRRRDGGFPPVIEFLIASSAAAFRDEGALVMSLSGAPLVHGDDAEQSPILGILDRLSSMLEPVYGFGSLHRFKQKFNPRGEPLYLLYRDEGDLAAIGLGLTRAFLPDAGVGQLAKAGLSLVRSGD